MTSGPEEWSRGSDEKKIVRKKEHVRKKIARALNHL